MSVEATSWAYRMDDLGLTSLQKFLLVTLGNCADAYGVTYVGQALLAAYCVTSRETISRNMGVLEKLGLIARHERRRKNGSRTSDWTVLAPCWANRGDMRNAPLEEFPASVAELARRGDRSSCDATSCDAERPGHVTQTGGPDPSEEPSVGSVRASAPVKFGGKPVKAESWVLTQRVLAEYNEQAGSKLRPVTSGGEMSEAAKRVYGRVRTYPDITFDEHADIIRRTLASRWWGKGDPTIGVVYGPNVFEDNITRKPTSSSYSGSKAEKAARAADDMAAIERLVRKTRGDE